MSRTFSATLTIALLSLLAGCGGGGSSTPTPAPQPAAPQIRLLAGIQGNGEGYADGTGDAARFRQPMALTVGAGGNVFVADTGNQVIRKVSPAGVTTTLAGMAGVSGTADGSGAAARFSHLGGLILDAGGNLLVVDDCTIRRITPAGVVTTIAGRPGACDTVGPPPPDAPRLGWPALDRNGQLYVAGARAVYKVSAAGEFLPLAGGSGLDGSADGTGAAATFSIIGGLVADSAGNLYATDTLRAAIRKITPQGVVTTIAGMLGATGNVDAPGAQARFGVPTGLAIDSADNLYVTDSNAGVPDGSHHTIRKITPAGAVSTIAGVADSPGSADGPALSAQFREAAGIAADSNGDLYVADTANSTIRKISSGTVSTLAGRALSAGSTDGPGLQARFWNSAGVAVDSAGNRYVADVRNHTIRKISAGGAVSTYAGLAGHAGNADGPAASARFASPFGVALDAAGNLYVADAADSANGQVRKISPAGVVSTFLDKTSGSAVTPLREPVGVALDAAGTIYVADRDNDIIYKASPAGVLTELAGKRIDIRDVNGRRGGRTSTDGVGPDARFFQIVGIAADASGNLFVTEGNGGVREVTANGTVTTIVGRDVSDQLGGIAVAPDGNLYFSDTAHHAIRKLTPAGALSIYAGGDASLHAVPGELPGKVGFVSSIAVSARGLVFTSEDAVYTIEP